MSYTRFRLLLNQVDSRRQDLDPEVGAANRPLSRQNAGLDPLPEGRDFAENLAL